MQTITYKGNQVYIVDAETVKEEAKCYVVRFHGKVYRWQKIHAEPARVYGPGKYAIRATFYNTLYDQNKIKRIIKSMIELFNHPLRRIVKN